MQSVPGLTALSLLAQLSLAASPKGRAPSFMSVSAVSSTGLYTVNVSRKAQAGRKDAADAASFPRAERRARTACEPSGAGFAGRSLGSHEDALEQPSPSYLRRAQYFKALCHLKLMWWQRCDSHFTGGETRRDHSLLLNLRLQTFF